LILFLYTDVDGRLQFFNVGIVSSIMFCDKWISLM